MFMPGPSRRNAQDLEFEIAPSFKVGNLNFVCRVTKTNLSRNSLGMQTFGEQPKFDVFLNPLEDSHEGYV
jgi:hypothetical protein